MLEIGINEGLNLGPDSRVTEKGGLFLSFSTGVAITSALELLEMEEPEAQNGNILIFPPNLTNYKDKTLRTAIDIMRDLRTEYKRLYVIFNLYFTKDELQKIYPVSCLLEGLNITRDNEQTMLVQESVVNKMFSNLSETIVKVINENKLWEKEAFRIKLLRQSAKKAFPRLTYKPEFGVWIELMTIPKEQSKVEFTKFEVGKGYDDATISLDAIEAEGAVFEEDTIPGDLPTEEEVSFE